MIESVTQSVRKQMRRLAVVIDKFSGGRISPNDITLISLLGHFAVMFAAANGSWVLAAILLTVFGLMDSLDGALAAVQKNSSAAGMLYDATADRIKEVLIYLGLVYFYTQQHDEFAVLVCVTALAGSLLVSYVKAKGETAIAAAGKSHSEVNREFADGLMQYQVRMAALIAGLLLSVVVPIVGLIAILAWFTALKRLIDISRRIS